MLTINAYYKCLLFLFFLNFSIGCTQLGLNNCKSTCENQYKQCNATSTILTYSTTSSTSSGSSSSVNPDINYTEGESNDTFYDCLNNSSGTAGNGLSPVRSTKDIAYYSSVNNKATISSDTDLDIFVATIITYYLNVYTITISSGSVNCQLYKASSYNFATDSTVPSNFTPLGTLSNSSTSYTFDATKGATGVTYFLCTGTGGSNYTLRASAPYTSVDPTVVGRTYTNYGFFNSCTKNKKACDNKCNTNLP